MKNGIVIVASLALAACGQSQTSKSPTPSLAPSRQAVDPKSAEAAADVVGEFANLLKAKRYKQAHRLWSGDPNSDAKFAARFAGYEIEGAAVGKPGALEGAAGSIYVQVPLQIFFASGDYTGSLSGLVTLRRVNDVPGSSDEQRRWHIVKTDLRPAD